MQKETKWGWPLLAGLLTAFPASGEGTAPAFSHDDWTAVLERFVDEQGFVDYGALSEDRAQLDRYLSSLASVSPEANPELFSNREEELAYYVNAYNAFVFAGVLKRWEPKLASVWSNPIASFNFFVMQKFISGGKKIHLKGLEDNTIRAGFQDPRIHAVLNCASFSCPRLGHRAVEPETLEEQFDAAMREFVSLPKHIRLDPERREVYVSKVFEWFAADFLDYEKSQGNRKPSLLDYVNRYRDPEDQVPSSYRVKFLKFDKTLNKQ